MTPQYRIIKTSAYKGCEPITAYMVQVQNNTWHGTTWSNIKGFEDKAKAVALYNILIDL